MKAYFSIFLALVITEKVHAQADIDDMLPINQIQIIGSHNSYKEAIEPELFDFIISKDSAAMQLQYAHIPIPEQLEMGLRNLEIDTYADSQGGRFAHPKSLDIAESKQVYDREGAMSKPGFKVLHIPDIDFRTSCYTFKDCLLQIRKWSEANPEHTPIFITLEAKDGEANVFDTQPETFTPLLFDELDELIFTHLRAENLITPDKVRGDYKTLEEAVLNSHPKRIYHSYPCRRRY